MACHNEYMSCALCRIPCAKEDWRALGHAWHRNHFRCVHCGTAFADGSYLALNLDQCVVDDMFGQCTAKRTIPLEHGFGVNGARRMG